MRITKQTTMGEMLQYDIGIAQVLMESGMHCIGCPSSVGNRWKWPAWCMALMQMRF